MIVDLDEALLLAPLSQCVESLWLKQKYKDKNTIRNHIVFNLVPKMRNKDWQLAVKTREGLL
jgi:hypothetical protein